MAMYVIAGNKANLLERMTATSTASPDADSNYPTSKLFDRFPEVPFRFGSSSSASYINFDLNILTNGGMETASTAGSTELGTWTDVSGGTGDVTRTTVAGEFSVGTAGMKLSAGTSEAEAYQDVATKSGERTTITADLRSTAAGISSYVVIRDLITGNYLTTAAAWSATTAAALVNATSSFATVSLAFSVEGYSTTRSDQVTLRVTVLNNSTGTITYADQVYLWPSVDFVSVHGHNIDPTVTVTLQSSTDSFTTTTTEATFTVGQPSFYTALSSARDKQFWRVSFSGTNSTIDGAIYLGELMFAQKFQPARAMNLDPKMNLTDHQIRILTNPAHARSYRQGDWETRTFTMGFWYDSTSAYAEARDEIMRRSRFGHYSLVLVPLSSEGDVLYGKIEPVWGFGRPHANIWRGDEVVFTELPFPTFVA